MDFRVKSRSNVTKFDELYQEILLLTLSCYKFCHSDKCEQQLLSMSDFKDEKNAWGRAMSAFALTRVCPISCGCNRKLGLHTAMVWEITRVLTFLGERLLLKRFPTSAKLAEYIGVANGYRCALSYHMPTTYYSQNERAYDLICNAQYILNKIKEVKAKSKR